MNYYEILGISLYSSEKEIKSAYRNLVKRHHPDAGGDANIFKKITEAYEFLMNQSQRQWYDEMLRDQKEQAESQQEREGNNAAQEEVLVPPKKRANIGVIASLLVASIALFLSINNQLREPVQNAVSETAYYEHRIKSLEEQNSKLTFDFNNLKNAMDVLVAENKQKEQAPPTVPASTSTPTSNTVQADETFTLGSSKEEVKAVMGTPTSINDFGSISTWRYKLSSVSFDENGHVTGWDNFSGNLKLK